MLKTPNRKQEFYTRPRTKIISRKWESWGRNILNELSTEPSKKHSKGYKLVGSATPCSLEYQKGYKITNLTRFCNAQLTQKGGEMNPKELESTVYAVIYSKGCTGTK